MTYRLFQRFLTALFKVTQKNKYSRFCSLYVVNAQKKKKVASPLVSISTVDLTEIISLRYMIIHRSNIIPKILRSHDLCFKCLPRKNIYGDLNPCILLSITLKLFRFHSLSQQLESHLFKHKQVYGFIIIIFPPKSPGRVDLLYYFVITPWQMVAL